MINKIKYLIIFIAIVIVVSVSLFITYSLKDAEKIPKNNDLATTKTMLDFTVNESDKSVLNSDEILIVSKFEVVYFEEHNKWNLRIVITNNKDYNVNIDDNYEITLYDSGTIKKHDTMTIGVVLEDDLSKVNSVSIKKKLVNSE